MAYLRGRNPLLIFLSHMIGAVENDGGHVACFDLHEHHLQRIYADAVVMVVLVRVLPAASNRIKNQASWRRSAVESFGGRVTKCDG